MVLVGLSCDEYSDRVSFSREPENTQREYHLGPLDLLNHECNVGRYNSPSGFENNFPRTLYIVTKASTISDEVQAYKPVK